MELVIIYGLFNILNGTTSANYYRGILYLGVMSLLRYFKCFCILAVSHAFITYPLYAVVIVRRKQKKRQKNNPIFVEYTYHMNKESEDVIIKKDLLHQCHNRSTHVNYNVQLDSKVIF